MMKIQNRLLPIWLTYAAAMLVLLPAVSVCAQGEPGGALPEGAAPAKAPKTSPVAPLQPSEIRITSVNPAAAPSQPVDRAAAYYHMAMAAMYEDRAVTEGRADLVNKAVDEYKLALAADSTSPHLNDGLADLYFRTGRFHDAETTARELLKTSPDDLEAHKQLGRIYLRLLSEGQNATSPSALTESALTMAIAEFEKIVALQPNSIEDRMVLGQLYTVKHEAKKAEEQFKTAQAIEPDSEDVVLNLARLYAESGDVAHAAKVIEAIPVNDRSPKMESALGAAYEQLKQPKDAIAAFQRAADMDPDDAATLDALAQALLNNDQLDDALKQYRLLADSDPENVEALVHISEIQRRQGKYADALTTIHKATQKDPKSPEAGFNEGVLLDVLGRYDEAAKVFENMVDLSSHANGAYTNEEKTNRSIFLERLGGVYQEQSKTDLAIATFQKLVELGGDSAVSGYKGQIGVYTDAKQFDKAIAVCHKAVDANPKDRDLKLILASELVDLGKADEGLTLAKGLLNNTADDRTIWVSLGQMNVRLRRWKDAEDAFDKASGLTTKKEDRINLLFLRGELAERQKHFESAEQFFRQVLELDPDSGMTLNYLGYMMADKGVRLQEALQMIRKAVQQEPTNGAYLDSLGWVYFKMGQNELAEDNLRQAVERDGSDPTVHEHLGDLYEKTGRIRLAAAQWELSLAEYAKSSPADVEPGDVAKVQKKLDNVRVKLAKQDSIAGTPRQE
jgi:tetratricopeptide (TPR) repeat protein